MIEWCGWMARTGKGRGMEMDSFWTGLDWEEEKEEDFPEFVRYDPFCRDRILLKLHGGYINVA